MSTQTETSVTKPLRDQGRVMAMIAWLGVCFAAIAPFGLVFGGGAVWDDNRLLPKFGVTGGHSLVELFSQPFLDRYYRPMVSASFWLDHTPWGTNFGVSHAINILLHLLAAILLVKTLLRATGNLTLAAVAGLFFAVQPAQVAATAWIGGRTDALATFFVACMAYSLYTASVSPKRTGWLVAATASFACALLSKEQCLPLVLLALLPLGAANGASVRKVFWPMAVVAAGYVALWMTIAPPQTVASATADPWLAKVGHTALYYGQLLIAPAPGTLHTLTNQNIASGGWLTAGLGLLFLAGVAWLFVVLWRWSELAAWWCGLAIFGLVPVLDLFSTPSFVVAPYKLGPTGLGVATLTALGVCALANRWQSVRTAAYAGAALACAYFLGLAAWSSYQWRSELTADQAIIEHDPASLFARFNAAVVYMNHGHYDDAEPELEEILRRVLGPSYQTMDGEAVIQRLRSDPAAREAIDSSQGLRKTHEAWLARVYLRLAEAQQANGNGAVARQTLEIGKTLNQAGEGTFNSHPNG